GNIGRGSDTIGINGQKLCLGPGCVDDFMVNIDYKRAVTGKGQAFLWRLAADCEKSITGNRQIKGLFGRLQRALRKLLRDTAQPDTLTGDGLRRLGRCSSEEVTKDRLAFFQADRACIRGVV